MPTSNSRLPNVIVIVMDTTRTKNLSCYGYHRQTTPFLETFASQSTVYTHATTVSSWTLPTHASLFTGTFPSRHGTYGWQSKLPSSLKTMAECFTEAGYDTVAFTSNGWVSEVYGLSRGFKTFFKNWQFFHVETDFFETYKQFETYKRLGGEAGIGTQLKAFMQGSLGRGNPLKNLTNAVYGRFFQRTFDYGAHKANQRIQQWYTGTRDREKPFFLFVNYMEPHLRYAAPGRYRFLHLPSGVSREQAKRVNQNAAKYLCGTVEMTAEDFDILEALYDGELSYLDAKLQELLHFFEAHGELDHSLVVVTSDHGENIGDHGLMSHKYSLHEPLMHIPLLIQWPGASRQGQVVADLVQIVDLFPTCVEWLGMNDREWTRHFQGRSLLSSCGVRSCAVAELLEPTPPLTFLQRMGGGVRKPLALYDRQLLALREKRYKYIWASDGQEELYDLRDDPGELRNLAGEMAQKVAEFRQDRAAWELQKKADHEEGQLAEDDKVVRKVLERLGYL